VKNLEEILQNVTVIEMVGDPKVSINQLHFDSRKVRESDVYFAQKGTNVDGHDFINESIKQGAKVVVCETLPENIDVNVTYLKVLNSAITLGQVSSNYYGNPSSKLKLVGVTGTNGKTTVVTLLYKLFTQLGLKSGMISTVVNNIGNQEVVSTHTTPDAIKLNALISKMVEAGCGYCFMEVSSHAVAQHRIAGLDFKGGVFTNITHEHLDFHETFKAYIQAKKAFFDSLSPDSFTLSNKDDKQGEVMLQNSKAKRSYYALKTAADFKSKIIDSDFEGLSLNMDGQEFWSPLIGKFNAYNLTAVYGVAVLLGEDKTKVLTTLSMLRAVDGRFQHIKIGDVNGIVDYAHSPDALENVLKTIKNIRNGNEELITVVGCGGDRDRAKRPMMSSIACTFSDRVILTSDNPRTEDPDKIIEEMKDGLDPVAKRKLLSIVNRREAIRTAISLSKPNDVVLIAGKGHESYQEVNGVRTHFNDMEELTKALTEHSQNSN